MPQFPRFAPGTLPYYLEKGLWWTYRIAAVVFLFSVVGVAFIGRYPTFVWGVIGGFFIWMGAWAARRLVLHYWDES